jgi:hypothetical protein
MTDTIKSSITYNGETAEFGTPESKALIEKMVREAYPEFGNGKKKAGVTINILRIEGVDVAFKKDHYVLKLEAHMSPGDVARLHHLSGQGVPISAVIESPQAQFDLVFQEVDTRTGEIRRESRPPADAGGE